jgi:hypothetical protein
VSGDSALARHTTAEMSDAVASFFFPDDVWAKAIFDLILTVRRGALPTEQLVSALVPVYFGRVASLIIENRDHTTEQSEGSVERQARQFELLKPYLVERWQEAP